MRLLIHIEADATVNYQRHPLIGLLPVIQHDLTKVRFHQLNLEFVSAV